MKNDIQEYKAVIITDEGPQFFYFQEFNSRAASILTEAICDEMKIYGVIVLDSSVDLVS